MNGFIFPYLVIVKGEPLYIMYTKELDYRDSL